ncbi:MAG TPA: hypothetical protein VFV37_10920 [Luteibaculaceae bacterium]|nr:hypothetical protein [Luteibaculaceae bacterium]
MLLTRYTFNPVAKTVTLFEVIPLELINSIFNKTAGVPIYTPAIAGRNATVSYSGYSTIITLQFDTSLQNATDDLKIEVCREEFQPLIGIYGSLVTTERSNQIQTRFDKSLAANDVTFTANGGTNTQPAGAHIIQINSGAGNGQPLLVTGKTMLYTNVHSNYATFGYGVKVLPTAAADYPWIGPFDPVTGSGFRIAYRTTGLALQYWRSNSLILEVLQANFDYPIDWLDTTKLNTFEIEWGGVPSAPVKFKVIKPDGGEFVFHTIRYPNQFQVGILPSPQLPISMGIVKTSGNSTNIEAFSDSWAGGTFFSGQNYRDYDRNGRFLVQGSIQAAGLTTPLSVTAHTVTPGRRFFLTEYTLSASNVLSAGGVITWTDNAAIVRRYIIGGLTNQFASSILESQEFNNAPFRINTNLVINTPALGVGGLLVFNFSGYESIID